MKKVLIVSAHPEPSSFCASLGKSAKEFYLEQGCEVKESDLYALNFNPVGDRSDFKSVLKPDYFKYQTEQLFAFENKQFDDSLQTEMDKLEWCDTLIFNFPLWWFGLPAILKGWVDKVFAMGFVYGNGKGVYENGIFKDKTAFIIMTTGGPEQSYSQNGTNGDMNNILFPIHHGMFYFVGMTVLPPFISWGPVRKSKIELEQEIEELKSYLIDTENLKPIYTNKK